MHNEIPDWLSRRLNSFTRCSKRKKLCKCFIIAVVNGHTSGLQDCGHRAGEGRLLNMCVIVFSPPFPRCERECGVCAGTSQGAAIEASLTAATRGPGADQIPGPGLCGAEWTWPGLGAAGVPQGLLFRLLSPAQGGGRDHAGSLLRKG